MSEYQRKKGLKAWARRYLSVGLLMTLAVLAYLMFFTENSVSANYIQTMRNDSIRNEIRLERDSLNYYRQLNRLLSTDRNTLEQIVREKFHMQRANEDVYLTE